jgi:hypothetical protein
MRPHRASLTDSSDVIPSLLNTFREYSKNLSRRRSSGPDEAPKPVSNGPSHDRTCSARRYMSPIILTCSFRSFKSSWLIQIASPHRIRVVCITSMWRISLNASARFAVTETKEPLIEILLRRLESSQVYENASVNRRVIERGSNRI